MMRTKPKQICQVLDGDIRAKILGDIVGDLAQLRWSQTTFQNHHTLSWTLYQFHNGVNRVLSGELGLFYLSEA